MAKGDEKKKTNQMIDTSYAQNQQEHVDDRTRNNAWADENHNRQSELYNTTATGLTNFATTGGLDQATMDRMRGLIGSSGGYGGGGAGLEGLYGSAVNGGTINVDRLRAAIPTLTKLMETGGYDAAEKALINKDIGALRDIGHHQYAGISDADLAAWRGSGVFDEFAQTGGISDRDKMMLRARGTAPISSMYTGLQNEADRLNRVGNSSAPGKAALMSRLARNSAKDIGAQALDTELGITDRVLEGRKWGAENRASAESGIQNLVLPTKTNSLNSAIENSRGIQEFIAAMQLQSGLGLSDIEANVENMLMSERRWGAQGLESSAARASAGAGARNSDMLDLERYFLEYGNDNKMSGLAGLGGLYNSTSDQNSQYLDRSLAERGLTQSAAGNSTDQRMRNNPSFDWSNFLGQALGAGSGIATGLWGGNTGFTGGRP